LGGVQGLTNRIQPVREFSVAWEDKVKTLEANELKVKYIWHNFLEPLS
jgi:hypothetical protein